MRILSPNAKYIFQLDDKLLENKDTRDSMQVVKETWVENVYQINKSDFYDTKVFIDLGANIGAVSLFVASFNDSLSDGEKPIKVYAYEPEPTNLHYLNLNIKENHKVTDIKIKDKAVDKFEGTACISARGGNSTLNPQSGSEVKVITLDKVFSDNNLTECDVMKVDIEGSEYNIFMEATYETLRKIKYLTMEFSIANPDRFGKLIANLAEVFNLHIIGRPSTGGYIYGRRY